MGFKTFYPHHVLSRLQYFEKGLWFSKKLYFLKIILILTISPIQTCTVLLVILAVAVEIPEMFAFEVQRGNVYTHSKQ